MSDTHPRLPVVRREPPPSTHDLEVETTIRVWDGAHGEYHRFEFVATRVRGDGHVSPQQDTVDAFCDAAREVERNATEFLTRAYPPR